MIIKLNKKVAYPISAVIAIVAKVAIIYLGFTKNGGDDCANNINVATRKCKNCGTVNSMSSSSCTSCGRSLYYITSDTNGCYGDFSDTRGG